MKIAEDKKAAIHLCMSNDIGWDLYRSFLAVLAEGSLSAAARALGMTQPTVGRHIAALEKALGVVLFTRTPSGLMPAEAAWRLRSHAETMRSAAAALQRAAEGSWGEGVQGTVRVSASEVMGVEVLPPIMAALREAYPRLRVELVLSNRVQDLLRREADIAVRMTQPQQELLIARRVRSVEVGLHAHPHYLAQHGMPESLAELGQHSLIGFDRETPFIRAASSAWPTWTRESFALRCDSDLGQLALLRAGCGIGVCQVALAQREPRLERVLPQQFSMQLETWVTMHEDLRRSLACKTTFDALVQGLSDA
jgi:DNA-binding transcriptional LysR family regulator